MNGSFANCPEWLAELIVNSGGSVSFHQYMDWALNHSEYGSYSSGSLKLGTKGDFVTSPSLGPDFAALLARQVVDWLEQLQQENFNNLPLSLIEIGPGEGDLAFDLIQELEQISPEITKRLELILVDINQGMIKRQKERLSNICKVPIRWLSLDELAENPVIGVILAHEMLDALPVERIILRNNMLFRLGVKLEAINSHSLLSFDELPISSSLLDSLLELENEVGIKIPPDGASDGWSSELHIDMNQWLDKVSKTLIYGSLLIIDYALEATRYYNNSRQSGTMMSYKNQYASSDLLKDPGFCDLTSHLCLETLLYYAQKNKWLLLGHTRQGLALLALGLAERLNSLQKLSSEQLDIALSRRESLLRLVDPAGLGEFRWLAFEVNNQEDYIKSNIGLKTRFLTEPDN